MNALVRPGNQLPSLIENFFGRDMNDFFGQSAVQNVPAVNVVEHSDGFRIEVAAPGLKRDDFKINLNHNNLSISAYKEERSESSGNTGNEGNGQARDGERYTRREFSYTSFQRTFMLPNSADAENIQAKYEDGVLRIEIPKREEAKVKPPRQIQIGE